MKNQWRCVCRVNPTILIDFWSVRCWSDIYEPIYRWKDLILEITVRVGLKSEIDIRYLIFCEQKIRYLIISISDNGHTQTVISRIRAFRWYMGSYMSYQYLTQDRSIKMVGFTRQTRRHWFFIKKIGPIKIEHFFI